MKFLVMFVLAIVALSVVDVMSQGTCEDEGKHCFLYTAYCSASNEWMKHWCAKTCNLCPEVPPPLI